MFWCVRARNSARGCSLLFCVAAQNVAGTGGSRLGRRRSPYGGERKGKKSGFALYILLLSGRPWSILKGTLVGSSISSGRTTSWRKKRKEGIPSVRRLGPRISHPQGTRGRQSREAHVDDGSRTLGEQRMLWSI